MEIKLIAIDKIIICSIVYMLSLRLGGYFMKRTFKKIVCNLLRGFGSILEIMPSSKIMNLPKIKTDEEAIKSDWDSIGNDFKKVISKLE